MTEALLLSGGLDSTALAAWIQPELAFTVDYGQACAQGEIRAATAVATGLEIEHEVIEVNCSDLGSGDLAGTEPLAIAPMREWWPFRNQLIITLASIRAVELGIDKLLLGIVASDSQHSDGRREFLDTINHLSSLQEGELEVDAPAIDMDSVELINTSGVSRSILGWCHSCHTANYGCGQCRGCAKHRTVRRSLMER